MKYFLLKKIGTVLGVILLLLIALEMISGVISDRNRYKNDARHNIAQSWTGAQSIIGPILVIPYYERVSTTLWDKKQKQEIVKTENVYKKLYLIPENLTIQGNVVSEIRYKGMYAVPVYTSKMAFTGNFNNQHIIDQAVNNKNIFKWDKPYLAVNIGDIRGIPSRPEFYWDNRPFKFIPGSNINAIPQGIHTLLPPLDTETLLDYPFKFELNLRGMESLMFSPAAVNTRVTLQSNWPHPGFNGRYMPALREITATGVSASWQVSSFSSNIDQQLKQCKKGQCSPLLANTFGVTLVQPVDIYQQAERSIKYAILFIGLTFVAFFVFEIIKNLRIHPIQYLLIGLALAIFYLLLVSLSEHIAFHWAYLAAASASSVLLGFYLTGVLQNRRQGLLFAAMTAALYGILFIILRSEDAALLMGSILLFGTLTLLMMITRKIDWYSLNNKT